MSLALVGNRFRLGESCPIIWEPSGSDGFADRMIFVGLQFSGVLGELVEH